MLSRSFNILGTGEYRPEYVVPSHYLDGTLKLPDGSVEKKSGVESRRWAEYGRETTSFMGAAAARQALEAAGLKPEDVDCVISAGGTVERAIPCTAVLVQRELGLSGSTIPCFDVNSTCLSFLTALDTASALLEVGRFKRILIVSSDIPSLGLDADHLESYSIFGDGAAAAVIGKDSERGSVEVIASHMETYSSAAEVCNVRAGGTAMHPCREELEYEEFVVASRFSMDGKAAYKVSAEHIEGFVSSLFQGTDLGIGDMDLVVPHQASMLAMHHLRKKLGIAEDRLVDIFADHGNQVAASIPTALHTAITQGRIKPGNRVLLIGTGAGISIAGMVLSFK
ncbi:beta-ketoacyl-ACP synthase III [Agrobacterium salinitolerans]|nr:beta-ketoacyl-ACP synthase III [Agrobacterium salinitolerans]